MTLGPTLWLVDDDEPFRTRMGRALEARGFSVVLAASVDEALTLLAEPPEFAVVDLKMPGRSGLELLAALSAADPLTRTVVLTGYGSIATAIEATKRGAIAYVAKPTDADELYAALMGAESTLTAIETPTLARAEWEYIHRVLADCGDNISEAARRLGIHRRSLQRKLQKYPPGR